MRNQVRQQLRSKPIKKTEKQRQLSTSIKLWENNIKKDQIKNIEEPINNEIEKLNNLIDDKTFMDKYQNALSDLNSLRSFTDEFKVKGLEGFHHKEQKRVLN